MKVLIIAGYTRSLLNFRGDLIQAMVRRGHQVITVGPETGCEKELAELGAKFLQLPFNRAGKNPLADLRLLRRLYKMLKSEKPQLVLGYTIKPVIYGSLAARLAGIRAYSMVTGMGYVFLAQGIKGHLVRVLSAMLYKTSFRCCEKVVFQNPDDISEFTRAGLLGQKKCVLVNGSGVNLTKFNSIPLPNQPVFLMICRLLRDKGVIEYLEAACKVKKTHPEAIFWLVGPLDSNPSGLKYSDISPYVDSGTVEYLGATEDVRPYLNQCLVYVLPSYREGTPRTVLEAMATGRPIITTDAPGCRETVVDGVNGFLVPIKDVEMLAEKMEWCIENRQELNRMAKESLRICRDKYDVNKVNEVMLRTMGL